MAYPAGICIQPDLDALQHPAVIAADRFAELAHGRLGQRRRYTGEAYIEHPREVARLLSGFDATPELLQAALLHDTVEDAGVSPDCLRAEFGDHVARIVCDLSNLEDRTTLSRAQRTALERQRIARCPSDSQTVRLADVLSNTRRIAELDPRFAGVYLPEKRQLVDVLERGEARLRQIVMQTIDEAIRRLESQAKREAGEASRPEEPIGP